MRKKLIGRKVECNLCNQRTVSGTTQVCRRLVFHFCVRCWLERQAESLRHMARVTERPA